MRLMSEPRDNLVLIRNKGAAVVALCLTVFVTALSFRELFAHPPHRSPWLFEPWFLQRLFHLHAYWPAIAINAFFYLYFCWLAIEFWRSPRGSERILLGGWGTAVIVGFIGNAVPAFMVTFIRVLEAVIWFITLLVAIDIFLKIRATDKSQSQDHPKL
jgi:hypothetical protein